MSKCILYIKLDPREQDHSWLNRLVIKQYVEIGGILIKGYDNIKISENHNNKIYILDLDLGQSLNHLNLHNISWESDCYWVPVQYGSNNTDLFINYEPRLYKYGVPKTSYKNHNIDYTIDNMSICQDFTIISKCRLELAPLPKVFDESTVKSYSFLGADHWYGLLRMGIRLNELKIRDRALEIFKQVWDIKPLRLEPYYLYLQCRSSSGKESDKATPEELLLLKKLLDTPQYPIMKHYHDQTIKIFKSVNSINF